MKFCLIRRALLFVVVANITGCANSGSSNYFVSLGEIGQARVEAKYGPGDYYFYRSNYRFSGTNDEKEKEDFFSLVESEGRSICEGELLLIKETLSYYSESGSVSVLVKCK